jgi:hypothetical protein
MLNLIVSYSNFYCFFVQVFLFIYPWGFSKADFMKYYVFFYFFPSHILVNIPSA